MIRMRCLVVVFAAVSLVAQTDQQRVDRVFAAYDKPGSPGCALGVIQNGAFAYRKGYGSGSLELGTPLTAQSVFYMGSVSKQFTAASIVLAAEQGFLSLDDDVRKFIPEIPDYGQPVTLGEMLHHTSGFRDILGLLSLSGRDAKDLHSKEEFLDLIARQKALNFKPGAEYLYSNTNYFLLGIVIERATKKPFAQFAAENIFQPLGMVHTLFYDDHTAIVPGRVPAYEPSGKGGFLVDWSSNFDQVGAGGLMSSVDDLLLWDRNFYDNRLGKGTLLRELQTRGVLNGGKTITYALGLEMSSYRGLPIVDHDGALFGYRTALLRFPEQRFTVVCLCNLSSSDTADLSRKVADVYLEKQLQAVEVKPDSGAVSSRMRPVHLSNSELAVYAGAFQSTELNAIYKLSVESGSLTLRVNWNAPIKLEPMGHDQFVAGDLGTVTFLKDAKGAIAGLSLSQDRIRNLRFAKIK